MKIQLKDVLPGELFWTSPGYHTQGHLSDAGVGLASGQYLYQGNFVFEEHLQDEVYVNRLPESVTEVPVKTVVLSDPMTLHCLESAVDTFTVQGRYPDNILHMSMNDGDNDESLYIVVSAEDEGKLRQYLLERAGLVAITLEENKDRIVMRNNHEGFVEEIEELKSRVAAIRKVLQEPEKGKGRISEIRHLLREMVPLEELDPFAEKAKSRVQEINWGEDAPEDMFVHVGSKDLPDGSREDIYELYSEEKHGDVETWTRSMVMSMNDHMPGRDKAVIRETVKTPVRTEREIRMEILVLQVELLSVTSGLSKEEIIDRCLDRAKKDEQIRQMDLNSKNDF